MNTKEMRLLEKAFDAEVHAALSGGMHLIQSRTKLAEKMVADGMLAEKSIAIGGRFPVEVKGLELTELGRMTYCMSCDPLPDNAKLSGAEGVRS